MSQYSARVGVARRGHQLARVLAVGRLDDSVGKLKGLQRLCTALNALQDALVSPRHYDVPADDGRVPGELRADLLRHFIAEPDSADVVRRVADKPAVKVARGRTGLSGDVNLGLQRAGGRRTG